MNIGSDDESMKTQPSSAGFDKGRLCRSAQYVRTSR